MHPACRYFVVLSMSVVAVVSFTAATLAEQVVVTTKDGSEYKGELVADDDKGVKLRISGIVTIIASENIRDVKSVLTPAEQYRQERAKIDNDDLEGRYKLASWLFSNKEYTLAQKELADMVKRFPKDGRVIQLRKLVDARIKLLTEKQQKQPKPAEKPTKATAQPQGADSQSPAGRKDPLDDRLTKEQINLIRVYEIDLNQRRAPRIVIPRDVITEFLAKYANEDDQLRGLRAQRAFKGASAARQLDKIFEH